MFLLWKFVDGEAELLLSPLEFALGRSGLEPWVSAEEEADGWACDENSAGDRVGASEIRGESQDVVHLRWGGYDFLLKIYICL